MLNADLLTSHISISHSQEVVQVLEKIEWTLLKQTASIYIKLTRIKDKQQIA